MLKKKIFYKVITNDYSLSEWTTEDLYDAYRHAAYISRLHPEVKVVEITIKEIWRNDNGQQG